VPLRLAPTIAGAFYLRKSSGSLAMFAAIRLAYAIPNFFDTCARV